MNQNEHNLTHSRLMRETSRIAESIQETGEAAWEKLASFARETYDRWRDETPAEQAPSKIVEQGPHAPTVQAPPAATEPLHADIVARAAPQDDAGVPPADFDERPQNVEQMVPSGEGKAQEMRRRIEEE